MVWETAGWIPGHNPRCFRWISSSIWCWEDPHHIGSEETPSKHKICRKSHVKDGLNQRPDYSEAGLVFPSDRGSQYTYHRFQQLLHEHGMIQPFSDSGRPHDNAVAESFFASFKKEELYRKNYSSEKEFKQGVDSYIIFYNQQRPHRTLKNQTPEQVEAAFVIQQPDMWGVRIPLFTRFPLRFWTVCI